MCGLPGNRTPMNDLQGQCNPIILAAHKLFGGDRRYRPDLVSNLARITRSLLLPPNCSSRSPSLWDGIGFLNFFIDDSIGYPHCSELGVTTSGFS